MKKNELVEKLTYDLVENYDIYKDIKLILLKIIRQYDKNYTDFSYNEFCIKFLNKLKIELKNIEKDDIVYYIDLALKILLNVIIDELDKIKNIEGIKNLEKELKKLKKN